jgi:hypothetical protein
VCQYYFKANSQETNMTGAALFVVFSSSCIVEINFKGKLFVKDFIKFQLDEGGPSHVV